MTDVMMAHYGGLAQLAGGEAVKWNENMAGAIIAALPPLIVSIIPDR